MVAFIQEIALHFSNGGAFRISIKSIQWMVSYDDYGDIVLRRQQRSQTNSAEHDYSLWSPVLTDQSVSCFKSVESMAAEELILSESE